MRTRRPGIFAVGVAVAGMALAWTARAIDQPVWTQYPYLYLHEEDQWAYLWPQDTQWCLNLDSGAWARMSDGAFAGGWRWLDYPYLHPLGAGPGYYLNETDTQWVYYFKSRRWLPLGWQPRDWGGADARRVVGYAPDASPSQAAMERLTHVIAFSLQVRTDGSLDASLVPADLATLVTRAHGAGAKALVCVGGDGRSEGFSAVAADAARRRTLARNLAAYCSAHGLDGVDLDWEFPGFFERANFAALLATVREELGRGRLLTVAMHADSAAFLWANAYDPVDWIHIMAYDDPDAHAPREFVYLLDDWRLRGIPEHKLVLGLPFYGRNAQDQVLWYRDLVARYAPRPDADVAGGYSFNGVDTATFKAQYARDYGFGGVMVWQVAQDVAPTDARSLLDAIHDAMTAP